MEVEVDADGEVLWCRAVVTAVLIDGWFALRISDRRGDGKDWIDWFTWQDENVDWRRVSKKAPHANQPKAVSSPQDASPIAPSTAATRGGAGGSGAAAASSDPLHLRLFVDEVEEVAHLVRPTSALTFFAPSSSRRSAKPMRLEADAGPVLEWDEQLEGQRCDYLVGEGVWLGGVIVSQRPGRSSYSIRLANGLVVQRGLPDHRVVLHAEQDACLETVLDSGPADAAAAAAEAAVMGAKAEGAVAQAETKVEVKVEAEAEAEMEVEVEAEVGAAAEATTAADAAAAKLDADGGTSTGACARYRLDTSVHCTASEFGRCANCGRPREEHEQEGDVQPLVLYRSSIGPSGWRGVRLASMLSGCGNATSSGFECAMFVNGRERSYGIFATADEAAREYGRVVREPTDDLEKCSSNCMLMRCRPPPTNDRCESRWWRRTSSTTRRGRAR